MRNGIVQIFSLGCFFLYILINMFCVGALCFDFFIGFNYRVNSVYFLCSLCIINGSNILIVKEFLLIFIYI